jgi:methylated-DNA-[protein]-cysteine S-methyltransferase
MRDVERVLRETARPPQGWSAEAADRLIERAAREGLLDVAYGEVDSPFGSLLVAVTPRGLVRLSYPEEHGVLEELARRVSPRILRAPAGIDEVRRELEEYFEERRRRFDVPIDWRLTAGFGRRILRATARIPFGSVSTYREVASEAGSPLATRAAGNALGRNPIPIVVPCHRVIRTGGHLGGYTGGLDRKEALLRLEGVLRTGGER